MHVCLVCKEVYEPRFLPQPDERMGDYIPCPKLNCYGDVIHLDELIAPTILTLLEKNYYTKYCCSGHHYDQDSTPYIYFHDDCMPSYPPEGFMVEKDYNGNLNTIRGRKEDDYESMYDYIIRVNKELYNWTLSLPVNDNYVDGEEYL